MDGVPEKLFSTDNTKADDEDQGLSSRIIDDSSHLMKIDMMSETPDQIFAEEPGDTEEPAKSAAVTEEPTKDKAAQPEKNVEAEEIEDEQTAIQGEETSAAEPSTERPTEVQQKTDETATDETEADETATDETATDETAADETAADETAADETAVDETAADETAADETAVDETEADESAVKEMTGEEIPTEETMETDTAVTEEAATEQQQESAGTPEESTEDAAGPVKDKADETKTVDDETSGNPVDAAMEATVEGEKKISEDVSSSAAAVVLEEEVVEEVVMEPSGTDIQQNTTTDSPIKTIDVSINGAVVTAEIIQEPMEGVNSPEKEPYIPDSDIVTELPDSHTDVVVTHLERPQVFAQIIEEEIIEEETVEGSSSQPMRYPQQPFPNEVYQHHYQLPQHHLQNPHHYNEDYFNRNISCHLFKGDPNMLDDQDGLVRQDGLHRQHAVHHSDDFITSLEHPRRLQAREDAAKKKDESMLLSTKKIIDSTDDVLRSAQALLKSTSGGAEGQQPSKEQLQNVQGARQAYHPQQREKRQKKKKPKPDVKEKEVDPDYDPEDDFDDKAFLSPKDLEAAAFASRLPADRMTKQEAISFADIFNTTKEAQSHFLYIRNRLLFVWLEDPKIKLTVENALPRIEPPHNDDDKLVVRVYDYLHRYGFINFGVYTSPSPPEVAHSAPKVLIVGAGISGLTAARQLTEFGLNVEVIEARAVVGGRVSTYRDGAHVADLGAMVVTGLGGNPLAVLAKQLNLDLMPIKQDCPLYEFTGQMVPKERDERVEREFNRLLEATTYMSHQLNVNSINGRPVSLGQALEIIIKLQIRQVKEKQLKHGRERCEIQEKLNHIQQALFPLHEKIKDSHSKYLELKMKHEELSDQLGEVIRDQKAEFEVKAAYKVMLETFAEYDALLKEQQELEVQLTKMEQMVPNEIYMTPQERHVLDWHCANLEFANAAPLSALSLKHWDQDDDFEFTGNHLVVHDGMSTIAEAMAKGLNIRHNTACVGIKYTDDGVEIATREVNQHNNSWSTNSTNSITADAVLLTIPLGVLKKEKLKFDPPLPEWKTSAIKRMGFGNLNKVVLCFNKVFWDPSIHLFGHVSNSTISRGELFLFWSICKAPVLIALIAGEAATVIETVPDEAIVGRAMTILRAIFGFQTVPQPSKHRVTRWRGDAWALGSYSYVAAGSSGNDYDDLARPVAPTNAADAQPRLFFAGEHTIRNYPATVHGAMLSGLREAGRITDQFLGPPYAREAPAGEAPAGAS